MQMSKFENLIEELVTETAPAKPVPRSFLWMSVSGCVALMVAMIILKFSLRSDLATFHFTTPLLWKLLTTAGVGLALTQLVLSAAQPQFRIRPLQLVPALLLGAAFIAPGFVAWVAKGAPNPALVGYGTCLASITVLGLMQLAGFLMWLRHGAPTHAKQAGFIAGLAAGAWASFAYSVFCSHDQMFYAATWYTLATLLLGVVGAVLAPRLCKW
jgi:hypothetical protein